MPRTLDVIDLERNAAKQQIKDLKTIHRELLYDIDFPHNAQQHFAKLQQELADAEARAEELRQRTLGAHWRTQTAQLEEYRQEICGALESWQAHYAALTDEYNEAARLHNLKRDPDLKPELIRLIKLAKNVPQEQLQAIIADLMASAQESPGSQPTEIENVEQDTSADAMPTLPSAVESSSDEVQQLPLQSE